MASFSFQAAQSREHLIRLAKGYLARDFAAYSREHKNDHMQLDVAKSDDQTHISGLPFPLQLLFRQLQHPEEPGIQ